MLAVFTWYLQRKLFYFIQDMSANQYSLIHNFASLAFSGVAVLAVHFETGKTDCRSDGRSWLWFKSLWYVLTRSQPLPSCSYWSYWDKNHRQFANEQNLTVSVDILPNTVAEAESLSSSKWTLKPFPPLFFRLGYNFSFSLSVYHLISPLIVVHDRYRR